VTQTIDIKSVNVAQPQVLRRLKKGPVYSSINKSPVVLDEILLTYTNLQGDQQVDTKPKPDGRQLHGGNEKAVYVYPVEHYVFWRADLGLKLPIPSFGENLTTAGITEEEVHFGDKWQWGTALLEVSKPRQPCFKLMWHLGVKNIEELMWQNGCCGWYLRVLEPGIVPTTGTIEIIEQKLQSLTVFEMLQTKLQNRLKK